MSEMKQEPTGAGADGPTTQPVDKRGLAAAASALVSAGIGEIAVVYSRTPALKHNSLTDIEWLILPAVLAGQFYVVEAANGESGLRAPIAAATWAFVSPEVDAKLSSNLARRIRLHPDGWKCGEIGWIVDCAGAPRGVSAAIAWLKAGPFKDRNAKIVVRDHSGQARVATLDDAAVAAAEEAQGRAQQIVSLSSFAWRWRRPTAAAAPAARYELAPRSGGVRPVSASAAKIGETSGASMHAESWISAP
jgi:hemolysin-activating ACP:hemolysin acyltransferase